VTPANLDSALASYTAGIDAEMELLCELQQMSDRQKMASAADDLANLRQLADARARVMEALLNLDAQLLPLRGTLMTHLDLARTRPGFEAAARRHRSAREIVAKILECDARTVSAMTDAAAARRELAHTLELGGTTLAAYRRIIAPPPAHASLFDQRG
jgi:D-Tyr-tRNAtyr deacylase